MDDVVPMVARAMTAAAGGVAVTVKAAPRSSRAGVEGVVDMPDGGVALKVRIRSAPVDGKANKELIETLADAFGLAKRDVVFLSGETGKTKHLLLRGLTAAEAERRLLDS